jgi:hypothetical protein
MDRQPIYNEADKYATCENISQHIIPKSGLTCQLIHDRPYNQLQRSKKNQTQCYIIQQRISVP